MHSVLHPDVIDQIQRLGGKKLLRDLVELYLENMPIRMENLARGRGDRDLAEIERAAHSIRSSSVSLGARAVAEEAEAVEKLARGGGDEDLEARLEALSIRVEELLTYLKEEFSGEPS
jgi:HPt (histidine-containing phosphotransfer) domain-containing protein